MQGWRISMEDAHTAVLDLKPATEGKEHTPTPPDKRLAYFGVYDGHGGEKVAQFAGESVHKIVAKQEAFKTGDIEQALKDGFLATDRAILNGELAVTALHCTAHALSLCRSKVRRGSLWLHRVCQHYIKRQDLGSKSSLFYTLNCQQTKGLQANAGDSRSVLGVKGRAKPLSFDHKPQNEGMSLPNFWPTFC